MSQTEATSSASITERLSAGKVSFSYKNAAGETRNAIGTTNDADMPTEARGADLVQTGDNVTYYDLNVNGWRQFKMANLDESSVADA